MKKRKLMKVMAEGMSKPPARTRRSFRDPSKNPCVLSSQL